MTSRPRTYNARASVNAGRLASLAALSAKASGHPSQSVLTGNASQLPPERQHRGRSKAQERRGDESSEDARIKRQPLKRNAAGAHADTEATDIQGRYDCRDGRQGVLTYTWSATVSLNMESSHVLTHVLPAM